MTDVTTGLYGGRAKFDYLMEPLGRPGQPMQVVWDATYADVDLTRLTDFLEVQGHPSRRPRDGPQPPRVAARQVGAETRRRRSDGDDAAGRDADDAADAAGRHREGRSAAAASRVRSTRSCRSATCRSPGRSPTRSIPSGSTSRSGWAATEKTYVEFKGRTAWAQRSQIPFHVTSLDWQESDRVLAGIMTAFGAPTGAIDIGGRGEFDGVMLESFSRPRIEGRFVGDRMRAWDTIWGHGVADLVIENGYVDIKKSVIEHDGSRIDAEGKFSLGFPRKDGGEEINANITMTQAAAGGSAPRLRARRLPGRRTDVRRVPRLRQLPRAPRRRPAA